MIAQVRVRFLRSRWPQGSSLLYTNAAACEAVVYSSDDPCGLHGAIDGGLHGAIDGGLHGAIDGGLHGAGEVFMLTMPGTSIHSIPEHC